MGAARRQLAANAKLVVGLSGRRLCSCLASGASSSLDELRVSLDAAEPKSFLKVRGKDMFDRIVRNVSEFTALQRQLGATMPRVSLWLRTIGWLRTNSS
jgi:molybdenum cofactor biosynthesis enzyme MoaA